MRKYVNQSVGQPVDRLPSTVSSTRPSFSPPTQYHILSSHTFLAPSLLLQTQERRPCPCRPPAFTSPTIHYTHTLSLHPLSSHTLRKAPRVPAANPLHSFILRPTFRLPPQAAGLAIYILQNQPTTIRYPHTLLQPSFPSHAQERCPCPCRPVLPPSPFH